MACASSGARKVPPSVPARWTAAQIIASPWLFPSRACAPRARSSFAMWPMWRPPFPVMFNWRAAPALTSMKAERIVAIDGPSGSGKGTVSRAVARALGWALLDSGALYRLVALAGRRAGVGLDDGPRLGQLAQQLDIRFGSDSA